MPRVGAFVDLARGRAADVVWVRQTAREEGPPAPAMRRHLDADRLHLGALAELDPRLTPDPGGSDLVKPRQSAFYATDLEPLLRARRRWWVVLVGVTTNVCVLATAMDAAARDLPVVVADLTAARPIRGDKRELDAIQVRDALAFVGYAAGSVVAADALLEAV